MSADRGYVPVAPETVLAPGALLGVTVDGERVCVARTHDGGVTAFDDRCPHRGSRLSDGRLRGRMLTCAAHTWEFDVVTGGLLRLRAPARLAMRRTRIRDGMIEVAVGPAS